MNNLVGEFWYCISLEPIIHYINANSHGRFLFVLSKNIDPKSFQERYIIADPKSF